MVVPGSAQVKRQAEDGGARPTSSSGRLRVAARRLLDVPRHEPGHPRAGRALRLDLEPQLRGPPGRGRAHAPRQPGDGRRGRARRPLRRRAGARHETRCAQVTGRVGGARPRRRRHRPDHPEAVPEADRALGLRRVPLLRLDEGPRLRAAPARVRRARRSWSPAATSAAAPRASTRRGRSRTTASASCSRRPSATSSARTRSSRASRRSRSPRRSSRGSGPRSPARTS